MSTVIFGRLRAAAKRIQHDALTVILWRETRIPPIVVRLLAIAETRDQIRARASLSCAAPASSIS